jgi:hypothetical protein
LKHPATECLTPTRDRAAAAVPQSAAECQRTGPWDDDLGLLEGDLAAVADDFRADLDERMQLETNLARLPAKRAAILRAAPR